MEENQFQEIPNTFNPKTRRPLPKKTVVLIVFIIFVVLSVVFVKVTSKPKTQSTETISTSPSPIESTMPSLSPEASASPTESPSPSPTPKPSVNPVDKATGLDRSKLNVVIQNGSGEAGVAGKASDYLKNLGYNVSSTGNADNYNYTNVFIQVKADKSDYFSLLKKDLGFSYTVGTASADLSTSLSEDALVIIGK